ncbi:LysR family transcriptional regulator [Curtobacterium flaccumfaciens]|uniref:LysR family transcriptional regulator n=1 Tax=Curtobacterium flaccumfaciens TaxID=2035 RepID=UPI001BDF7339|nr:LysR family transcriptional regulator [Curtobacterium flaccumfaciens]MBT1585574.1 LysR family transcriptional regulator [Curtobacterium flaccumfaciens pv. flaccumfaciens]MCS5495188.1 LysR family transcriptional regulator [Curtobacterium flaccumfaciens pv. flaccumfaciens]MCX2798164.1 LysR family transcriptional regulator [Curtobacterium flaccumfaciens pv. flaccumfaciens]
MLDVVEMRALECFVAVADEGSFSRAAVRMGVSQPSVSQQVRALETQVAGPLFERGSRGVMLTATGEALLPTARKALAAMNEFEMAASERGGQLGGRINLGVIDGLEETVLPAALTTLRRRHPLLELRMIDGTSGKLLDQLVAGELDAVVVAEPPRALPDFFGTHPFLEEELVIVDYTTPTAGSVEPVRLRDVAERITVSYPPESGVRTLIDDAARRERADLRFPYTTSDPALHIALAKAGLGAALTVGSAEALAAVPPQYRSPLMPPIMLRKVLVWMQQPRPGRAVEELIAAVRGD